MPSRRDGADAQYMQYLSKNRITSPQLGYVKNLFKRPDVLFECLCGQQDSYKWPKAMRKTAKPENVRSWKCHFSYSCFFLRSAFNFSRYLANALSTHRHFSTKLILVTTRSSTTTQRLHTFKFTLVNKSHSQHSGAAVRCEGRHFLMLYACARVVSFLSQILRSLGWERD